MSFLHVLLTVALSLALIWARAVLTLIHGGGSWVLIVYVTVSLLFSWPSIEMVFAARLGAFPGPGVSLLMLPVRYVSFFDNASMEEKAYVKSQGRLNTFSHSLHCCTSLTVTWVAFRRRAMERIISSSDSSLTDLLRLWEPAASGSRTEPVRREMDCPSLILTSSTGWPFWLNPPWRLSRSSLYN